MSNNERIKTVIVLFISLVADIALFLVLVRVPGFTLSLKSVLLAFLEKLRKNYGNFVVVSVPLAFVFVLAIISSTFFICILSFS